MPLIQMLLEDEANSLNNLLQNTLRCPPEARLLLDVTVKHRWFTDSF